MLKSIMKRILLSFLAVVAMATVASAQQTTIVVEVEERPRGWRGYETNRFWDNWELAAGGGASMLQMTESFGKDPGKFLNRVGWNANIALTKWIVPVVGMRLQVDGGEFQNYSFTPKSYGEGIYKTPYLYVHGDILVADRAYLDFSFLKKKLLSLLELYGTAGVVILRMPRTKSLYFQPLLNFANAPNGTEGS